MNTRDGSRENIGKIGEQIAVEFLLKEGITILDRNYSEKWGELDIVGKRGKVTHFVEVKSISRGTTDTAPYRPEENMHENKAKRLRRIIQTYCASHKIHNWQFDLVAVLVFPETKQAKVRYLENLPL